MPARDPRTGRFRKNPRRKRRNPRTGPKIAAARAGFYVTINVTGEKAKSVGPYPTRRAANADGKALLYYIRDRYGYTRDDTKVQTRRGPFNRTTGKRIEVAYTLVPQEGGRPIARVTIDERQPVYAAGIISRARRKRKAS